MYWIATKFFCTSHSLLKKINKENILYRQNFNEMDFIIDNIYLGDFRAADNLSLLQENKISKILICAKDLPRKFPNDFSYMNL